MSPLARYAPSHFLTFEPSHLLTAPPISYLPYPISCSSAQGRGLADLFPALRALVLIVVNPLSFLHLHLNLHQTTPYPIFHIPLSILNLNLILNLNEEPIS